MLYILGDADRVREKVEAALFGNDLATLTLFSQTLTGAIAKLVREMGEQFGAETVMAGGDDVLLTVMPHRFDEDILGHLVRAFADTTGCSISFGIGESPDSAYLNLRRAKAAGGGIISRVSVK